ncbi:MAG TPA: DUF460 domain-containing protein [Candidatus Nanoarchaeia archaeon]|nr:DUF460 domain-containing protein [Candidatus Nanoarchaeia archaeon]
MGNRKLLIVGIDPGTTTAYAVLDIEGNLIKTDSSKNLDLNQLISEIIEIGKAVLVGTDKAKIPNLAYMFATRLGARAVNPNEDLKVEEKRKMISGFKVGDIRQADALAAALFAYKTSKPLLNKIDSYAKDCKKQEIKDKIKELVILRRISIKSAVGIIEEKNEEDRIIEKVITERKLSENDFLKLYNKLKNYESEIRLIKSHNNNLNSQIKNLEKSKNSEIKVKKNKKLHDFREKRIFSLENYIKSGNKEMDNLKSIIGNLNNKISNISNFYVLKKLDTLGLQEFNYKNKVLNIKKNDIVLVDDPNIVSNEVVELLREKISIIVYNKPLSPKIENSLPFVFMNSKNLKIDEDRYFGFADKKHFEAEKGKANWIGKIVSDYKFEKMGLIPP